MPDHPAHRRRAGGLGRWGRRGEAPPTVEETPEEVAAMAALTAGSAVADPGASALSDGSSHPDEVPEGPPAAETEGLAPEEGVSLPADVRTGVRTITLRVNRVANAVVYAWAVIAVLVFLFGAYRLTESGVISGVVLLALGVALAVWPARRLGPGRLLTMEVTPTRVRLTNAFEAATEVDRTATLRAVLWVRRSYAGAEPRLRGLWLVDEEALAAAARPAGFSTERLQRFLANVAIPSQLVDAEQPPFPAR